ncbi:MAG: thioredoxin-disulfide reductase [Candidatus Buchananbacteria bacterium RIFCSPHIGHO2_02_FULL_40_13]|uniref:Thioredoxin reductase n=1 Tax=Candidatus Buchananbacteria bacterium RIFCSPLOWO2_01_FULL_39_33 TaxID=1797543 RepID=A0A1G1YK50_9BACT|nr:MAG: thioredoxin-disulfide reductase [Candidatus Buchananbacteria bacterium RIFCSPHIGHO2_01_FULL_40_35]OGY50032.1 MAG: thioredoxin-disulfide reductase [Candidatus Buchananbacteria bacterium RIFCSPHIGHO2_02_FULL_40_13]OGY52689.1 MAG: thioredoxin-disulfide reductase [Candidatus Buchananbacteria bacterium RIFCSPLOWO2_01_FULL_39_33]
MPEKKQYDLLIIGAGPAGLTAAIYATRRKLKTMVVSLTIGGQMALTNEIENYPGCDLVDGLVLATKMQDQAVKWGADFDFNEITEIKSKDNIFIASTNQTDYEVKSIILAFGLTPRKLGCPGEKEFTGRGVVYCATCDGPLFKNKVIAIVGGGNSAVESAEYMSKIAKQVYVLNRSDQFRASPHILEKVKGLKNIEVYCFTEIAEIKGDMVVKAVKLVNSQNKKIEELKVDGVFIEIGYEAKTDWLKGVVDLNDWGEIIIDHQSVTSTPGIFAAGDCTDTHHKQIVISAGEGAKASLGAYKYIIAKEGGSTVPDWGKCELVGTAKTAKIQLEK